MAMFNGYVGLPEGISKYQVKSPYELIKSPYIPAEFLLFPNDS